MSARNKSMVVLRNVETGEVVGECELTPARARAIVKAYAKAGLIVEVAA